jgi:hypothetical protein
MKPLEENIGETLHYICINSDFFFFWKRLQKHRKQKQKQLIVLYQAKKFLHSKGNNKQRDSLQNGK